MKIKTINTAALIVGIITILCVTVGLLIGRFFGADGWRWGLIFAVGSGVIVFVGDKQVMKSFFIQRIKPLYRIVLGRDIKTTELTAELEQTNHPERSVSAELNRWAEQNQKEIARLKENEKYRKEFVGNVSHEIKTPIFNIQGYISTLLDGGMNDPVIFRRYLERTEKSIDRLINITNDLEAISKLESGVLTLNYERFDIVSLTRDIVDTIEFEATKKNISVVVGSSEESSLMVSIYSSFLVYSLPKLSLDSPSRSLKLVFRKAWNRLGVSPCASISVITSVTGSVASSPCSSLKSSA
jgi:two-component system phosphate regulon sensor histidine kinase PhoR